MPMPNWWRHLNKHTFNRMAKENKYDFLTHVGRTSGKTFTTPMDAVSVPGGFAVVLVYGSSRTDWVKNVLAAGSAELRTKGGDSISLTNPRIARIDDVAAELPAGFSRPPGFMNVTEMMRFDAE